MGRVPATTRRNQLTTTAPTECATALTGASAPRLTVPFPGIDTCRPFRVSALTERVVVTNTLPCVDHPLLTADGVYVPQQDSQLLVDTLERTTVVAGRP